MYKLKAFLTTETYFDFSNRMPSHDLSTGDYTTAAFPLTQGGAFDGLGTEQAKPRNYTLTRKILIWFSTEAERKTYFEGLRALVGWRGRLYREWDNGTDVEWITARFVGISAERQIENRFHIEVDLTFEAYSHYWHGDFVGTWLLDSGEFFDTGLDLDAGGDEVVLDASPKSFTISMTGNAIVNDPTITITAGGANITAIEIKNTTAGHLAELDYTGTINAGDDLVINCANYSVLNNGSGDESNFAIGSTHAINEWFRLAPGDNTITVTFTGGSTDSEIDFDYYLGYK